MKKDRVRLIITTCIFALLPITACLIACALGGHKLSDVFLPASEWNDELFYFKQVEGIVKYGFPRGYFGFNESHALKLSFAAWSPVLVFPWIIWGLIFGWNLFSPVICNIVILTLAMAGFALLTKPTAKRTGIMALLFLTFTPFARYMLSGMPEVICFSLLILYIGLCYKAIVDKKKSCEIISLVLVCVMTLMRPYMLLFFPLPVFLLIKRNKKWGIVSSVLSIAATLFLYAMIKHFLGAEYFAPLFFTDWVTAFFEKGFFGGLKYFFSKLFYMTRDMCGHIGQGFVTGLCSGAIFSAFFTMLVVLICQFASDIRHYVKYPEKRDNTKFAVILLNGQMIITYIGMTFALLLMYKLTEGSKHLLTFIAAGIALVSIMYSKTYKKVAVLGVVFLFFFSLKAVDPYDYKIPERTTSLIARCENWSMFFESNLMLNENDVPNYDNSVIWCFNDIVGKDTTLTQWQYLYGLPAGFGISCCYRDYVLDNLNNLKSRYLAVCEGGEVDREAKEAGFREMRRFGGMVFYEIR